MSERQDQAAAINEATRCVSLWRAVLAVALREAGPAYRETRDRPCGVRDGGIRPRPSAA